MRALALLVLLASGAAYAVDLVCVGAPPVNGATIEPTSTQTAFVDAGVVRTSQLFLKSSPASGQTLDCLFANANADSNNIHMTCPLRTNSQVTLAGGTQLIQANTSFHTGSAVSIVDAAATAPTIATGCTGEAMTWAAGSASMRFDVGTSCTGVSTAVITLPGTATNCWTCSCFNTGAATNVRQSACSTTTATITNFGTSVATPADWTDGADIQCMCRGG